MPRLVTLLMLLVLVFVSVSGGFAYAGPGDQADALVIGRREAVSAAAEWSGQVVAIAVATLLSTIVAIGLSQHWAGRSSSL